MSFIPPFVTSPVPGLSPAITPLGMPAFPAAATSPADAALGALEQFRTPRPVPSLGLARLLPYGLLLAPVLIPAILQPFAPGVQGWLKDGWRGNPGYGIPNVLTPGVIPPGSTSNFYRVSWKIERTDGSCNPQPPIEGESRFNQGPIEKAVIRSFGVQPVACFPYNDELRSIGYKRAGQSVALGTNWASVAGNSFSLVAAREDGTAEGVPDPALPPVEQPYPPTQNPSPAPLPSLTPFAPLPFPALPSLPRLDPSISPDGEPLVRRPGQLPLLPPLISPQPSVLPQARPVPYPATGVSPPVLAPTEPTYPPAPSPNPTEGELKCDSPCLATIYDDLKEVKKNTDPNKGQPPTYVLALPVVSCDTDSPSLDIVQLVVQGSPMTGLSDRLVSQSLLAQSGCRGRTHKVAESLLLSGLSTESVQLFYSAALAPDVRFVRLEIEEPYSDSTLLRGGAYPTAGQRNFGAIAVCDRVGGGGYGQDVYDAHHLLSVARSAEPRFIKVLLKVGCRYRLFDTGERLVV